MHRRITLRPIPRLSPRLVALACAATIAAALAQAAPVDVDLPAQPLPDALKALARATGTSIAADSALLAGKAAPAVRGRLEAGEALARLLAGSGLEAVAQPQGGWLLRPAQAQASRTLKEVRVTAPAPRDGQTEGSPSYRGRYAGAATKIDLSARETPQSVSVLTRAQLDDQNFVELTEAAKVVPGVVVRRQSSLGSRSDILSRGYQASTYQLDGLTVSGNPATQESLDLALFDRVEALRGPAGLFSGAGEPGVMLNLVRKRALPETQLQAALGLGSRGRARAEADVTGPIAADGRLRGRLVALNEEFGAPLKALDGSKQAVYGTLEFDITPQSTLSAGATWQHGRGNYDTGLPAYPDGRLAPIPRDTAIVADWGRAEPESLVAFVESETQLEQGGKFKLAARRVERTQRDKYINGYSAVSEAGTSRFTQAQTVARDYEDTSADVYYSTPWQWAGQTHNLLLGADYRASDMQLRMGRGSMNTIADLFHYDPGAIPEPAYKPYADDTSRTRTHGFYGQVRFKPTQAITLVAGARKSWWKTSSLDHLAGTRSGYAVDGQFTPFGAVLFDLDSAWTLYASQAQIFQPQSGRLAGGGQIMPRRGRQAEIGIKGSLFDNRLNASAAVYRLTDTNRALADPDNAAFVIAAGKVRSEGFEAEIAGALSPRWDVSASYAYMRSVYLRGTATQTGTSFSTITPRHSLNLWARYRVPEQVVPGLEVGAGLRAVSDFYEALGSTRWRAGGYGVWSLFAAYQINPRLKLSVNIDNLFDRVYWERAGTATRSNYYGLPRSAMLMLRASF